MIFNDTETCGLHGPVVLIQYAVDDGPVVLHNVWKRPIQETLTLIETMMSHQGGICGFNLAFDHFHLCQLYTVLTLLEREVGSNELPEDYVELYALLEAEGRDGPCLKPFTAFDIMLHARKGKYQSTMDRKDIRIRRVPVALANPLAAELEKRIKLKDIYFARRKDQYASRWSVEEIQRSDDTYDPDFRDVVLRFAPSSALKTLAIDALEIEDQVLRFMDIEGDLPKPMEVGWAPFATALSDSSKGWQVKIGEKSGRAWPALIKYHIAHWEFNELAREYAEKDVIYTRDLYRFFGSPKPGDDDSILACMVGAVRWRGYSIDIEGIKQLRKKAVVKSLKAPKAPKAVFNYVSQAMNPVEAEIIRDSTKRVVLEKIAKWTDHPAAVRAQECLDARQAQKEVEIYDKLLQAGRFHASFKVIGTKSSRMSGTDGLNAQGIKHDKSVRRQFPLAWGDLELSGGDFSSFEVSIADADYNDPELRKQLLTCSLCEQVCTPDEYRESIACPHCGRYFIKCKCKNICIGPNPMCEKCNNFTPDGQPEDTRRKIHGLFGMELSPGMSYDDVTSTKGAEEDLYDKGKRGVFSQLYGGNYKTLMTRLGVDEDTAKKAEEGFANRYRGVRRARKQVENLFAALRQPGGIGARVEWHDPADYIESLTGFRRYFTLENDIIKALYKLANKPPVAWKSIKIKCQRRDREQTVGGAVMSALFGAAFSIQSQNIRAAANHRIQSTGATLTKELQCRIWNLQPGGIHSWVVQPMNVHDEIMVPCLPSVKDRISEIVKHFVNEKRPLVPLIKIDWSSTMQTWADK